MHFIASEITIQQPARRVLTTADAPYAHAAVLNAIKTVDSAASQRLHDAKRDKRFTVSLVDDGHRDPILRVSILADDDHDYASILLAAFASQHKLQLGRATVDVRNVAISGTPWSGVASWADLLQDDAQSIMRFEFVTPTAITKEDDQGRRFTSPLPVPNDIFRSLARRWKGLGGPPLPDNLDDFLQTGGCVIAFHRLHTVEFQISERTQIGFQGYVTYHCRKPDPVYVTALNALTRMAFFTGVGYQTARGMGLVRTELRGEV
jgi:CRISPR-associated endoribonuclease Cas6